MMRPGMKNGETRRGPRSFSTIAVSAMPSTPPMPEPIITPVAHLVLVGLSASSRHRRAPGVAAHMRIDDELVDLALLLRLHPLVGIVGAVGAVAVRDHAGDLAGQYRRRRSGRSLLAPLSPAIRRCQVVSTPQPSGVTIPRPVTTTRLMLPAPWPTPSAPDRRRNGTAA